MSRMGESNGKLLEKEEKILEKRIPVIAKENKSQNRRYFLIFISK